MGSPLDNEFIHSSNEEKEYVSDKRKKKFEILLAEKDKEIQQLKEDYRILEYKYSELVKFNSYPITNTASI